MSVRTSWELGTLAQALTEIEYPEYSVFSPSTAFPITFRDPLPEDVISSQKSTQSPLVFHTALLIGPQDYFVETC